MGTHVHGAALALALAAAGLASGSLGAQAQNPPPITDSYRLDFAIPDAPATDLIKADASTIERPSSTRELALALSDFTGPSGGFRVPRGFGVEVAPFLLMHGRTLTVRQYNENAALYRFRVSAATNRDSAQRAQVALGLRLTLRDDAELRANAGYQRVLADLTSMINAVYVAARLRTGPPPTPIVLNGEEQAQIRSVQDSLLAFKKHWEDASWNATAWDVAAAAGAGAADSLGTDLTFDRASAWSTYGLRVQTWGQLLLGLRAAAARPSPAADFRGSGSISGRFYMGENRYKGFAEASATAGSALQPSWLLNAGGEARFADSLWSTFSAGLEWGGGAAGTRPRLRSRFTLKLALPQLGEVL